MHGRGRQRVGQALLEQILINSRYGRVSGVTHQNERQRPARAIGYGQGAGVNSLEGAPLRGQHVRAGRPIGAPGALSQTNLTPLMRTIRRKRGGDMVPIDPRQLDPVLAQAPLEGR